MQPCKLTEQEFVRIYTFIHRKYGIDLSKKRVIIEGRLENYLRQMGFSNYSEYMNAVESDVTGKLELKLVDLLTTNHTYFMRESEHFDYFRKVVLPELKARHEKTDDLRVWCGASSSGEEPYTLAMIMTEFLGLEASNWDYSLLATDISNDILRQAINGIYTSEQIAPLPDSYKRRHFKQLPDTNLYQVNDELKKKVIYRKFNLMDEFPFRQNLHCIFLRNVLIYFEDPTKNAIIQKCYDNLEHGGYLFLGKTETIHREDTEFKLVYPSVFRKS